MKARTSLTLLFVMTAGLGLLATHVGITDAQSLGRRGSLGAVTAADIESDIDLSNVPAASGSITIQATGTLNFTSTGSQTFNAGAQETICTFISTNAYPTMRISAAGENQHPMISFRDDTTQMGCIGVDEASDVLTLGRTSINNDYLTIDASGNVGIGTKAQAISDGTGLHVAGKLIRVATSKTPASAAATGNAGEICWDASYIYVCTAANTWKRAALSTW